MISLVWAQAHCGAIGRDNTIPWHVPEDMAHFREVTGTGPVIMGRRTWDSLPERFRPLPGRRNIVITRSVDAEFPGAERANGLDAALKLVADVDSCIIGGEQTYIAAMEFATDLRVTEIDIDVDGADAFAPEIDSAMWQVASEGEWQTSTKGPRYRFVDYVRITA